MPDLLINDINVSNLIRERFQKKGAGWVGMINLPSGKNVDISAEAIKILVNELDYSGIYISFNRTCGDLQTMFKSSGIKMDKIYFIDTITKNTILEPPPRENCSYIESTKALTDITIEVTKLKAKIKSEKKFLIFDSAPLLLVYNSLIRSERFLHSLIQNIRSQGFIGIIFFFEADAHSELYTTVAEFSDEVIDITSKKIGIEDIIKYKLLDLEQKKFSEKKFEEAFQ